MDDFEKLSFVTEEDEFLDEHEERLENYYKKIKKDSTKTVIVDC